VSSTGAWSPIHLGFIAAIKWTTKLHKEPNVSDMQATRRVSPETGIHWSRADVPSLSGLARSCKLVFTYSRLGCSRILQLQVFSC
jgi:hypothetical protein